MIEERDVIGFLKDRQGQSTLDEISRGLGIPKYGPNSAYSLLNSLRLKGMVERIWIWARPDQPS